MARILIVDDAPEYVIQLKEFVESLGHAVETASDAAQVSAILSKRPVDLALLDFQMPGGGAPAAVRHIRSTPVLARLPILIFSSMPVERQKEWLGAVDRIAFLAKPFALADLKTAIDGLLALKP